MKKLLSVILSLVLLVNFSVVASANGEETQDVRIKSLYIEIPSDYDVVRNEDFNSATIELYDSTGAFVERYHEEIEPKDLNRDVFSMLISPMSTGTYDIISVWKEQEDGPAVTRLLLKLNRYSYMGYRQINSIESVSISTTSTGGMTLEDRDVVAISATNTFPTAQVNANGTGNITYSSQNAESIGLGFEASFLKSFGFSVDYSQTNTKNFFARKFVSIDFQYKLYPN